MAPSDAPSWEVLRRPAWWLAVAAIVLGGFWLRYRDVSEQVLGGDEFHAIRVAGELALSEIFTHYEPSDNSVVLTLYARVLMNMGGLTELNFRWPVILSGVLVLLAPFAFRRQLGTAATLVAIAFIATSPCAIYYSFVARPYGPAAVLLLCALWAWSRWLRRPSTRLLALFVASSALAVFLHLLCVLPVGLLVGLSWIASRRPEGPTARRVLSMTALLLLAGLLLFGPGLPALIETRLIDPVLPSVDKPLQLWLAFKRLAGEHTSMALVLILFSVLGSVRLFRRDLLPGVALAGVLPVVAAGLLLLPVHAWSTALTRYMFLAWPAFLMTVGVGVVVVFAAAQRQLASRSIVALLCLALGVATIAVRWGSELGRETATQAWMPWIPGLILVVSASGQLLAATARRFGVRSTATRSGSAPIAVLSLLVAAGMVAWTPVPILRAGPDSFRVRRDSLNLVSHATRQARASRVAPFFHEIADAEDAGEVVLVWPYTVNTVFWHPFVRQQIVHRRRVLPVNGRISSKRLPDGVDFQNSTDLADVEGLVDLGARYLVMCIGYPEELDEASELLSYYTSTLRPLLEWRVGSPVYRDEHVEIYDLWVERYRVITEAGRPVRIERPDGHVYDVVPGAVTGYVDVARIEDGQLQLDGWAVDPEAMRPAEGVLFYSTDGQVFVCPTGAQRGDIAEQFKQESLQRAGFQHWIPLQRFPRGKPVSLFVLALADRQASVLLYGVDAKWIQP